MFSWKLIYINMDINNSVNPSESIPGTIELGSGTDSVVFKREPPPPYSNEIPITNQPIVHQSVIDHTILKNKPAFYNCHKCGERVLTKVKFENSRKTHLCAGFICGFTFWCLLCCLAGIPYLVKTCKKAHHYCPNCNTFLGGYSRI